MLLKLEIYYKFFRFSIKWYTLSDAESGNTELFITNPRTLLKVLRNFGFVLHHIYINFNFFKVEFCCEVERYLAMYCSESLEKMSLSCNSAKVLLGNLHKPLANLTALRVYMSLNQVANNLHFDHKYLPKLKYIHMQNHCTRFRNSDTIHFENI